MQDPSGYAKEKLYLASLVLVKGEGGIRERLQDAALAVHTLSNPAHPAMPKKFQDEFDSIWAAITGDPAQFEGEVEIHAMIQKLPLDEAGALAERIFHLYVSLLHGRAL